MRKSMVGAAVAAMAVGGAGVAYAGDSSKTIGDDGRAVAVAGGPPMLFHVGPGDGFAEDLAAELGLSTEDVERALEAVAEKNMSEHRRELAEAIAEHLDAGVDEIESALATAEQKMREAFESGDLPDPGLFAQTLADELGLSEDEVTDALKEARAATFEAHRDEFPDRGELGSGAPAPPDGIGFALPAVPR
jgi:hypothetical protein